MRRTARYQPARRIRVYNLRILSSSYGHRLLADKGVLVPSRRSYQLRGDSHVQHG